MDKARRKELKKRGKEIAEQESAELQARLKANNPFELGDPRWVEAYKEETKNSVELRKNRTKVYTAAEIAKIGQVKETSITLEQAMFPHRRYYVECFKCGDFVPTNAGKDLQCSCGAAKISFIQRQYWVTPGEHRVVELTGANTVVLKKKWWQLWG